MNEPEKETLTLKLSAPEYERLIKMVHLGNWMINGVKVKRLPEYDAIEEKVLKSAGPELMEEYGIIHDETMEPTIPDGSYCMFRFEKGGSRGGLPVLVESRHVSDPETFQRYTIKRYKSEKQEFPDGAWQHKKIILSPDNKDFSPIILENVPEGDFRVVAEFVEALN